MFFHLLHNPQRWCKLHDFYAYVFLLQYLVRSQLFLKTDHYVPKAPGMKYKHYAPKADLVLVDGEAENVVKKINELVAEKQKNGLKVGVIATDETKDQYQADIVVSIGARADEDAIAQHLYKILREFDDWNVDAIYSESFATPRIGQAIMNRLLKAAGHQVLQV